MNRTLASAALAAALLATGDLAAQRSDNSGFMLGAHLAGTSLGTTGRGAESRSGGGAGIKLGYGFNERIALFLGLDGANLRHREGEGSGDTFAAASVDLGARVNFGNPSHALRPYLTATTTAVGLSDNVPMFDTMAEAQTVGGGLNVGIGTQYFLRRRLALDAAFLVTTGSFTEVKVDGTTTEIPGVSFEYGRVQLGVTWHP